MDKVISLQEKRDKKTEPFVKKTKETLRQIEKINEMLDRDTSELNEESTTFYFKQLFGELGNLRKIDREYTEEYNKAFNKEKKPLSDELDEMVREAIESGEDAMDGEDPDKE